MKKLLIGLLTFSLHLSAADMPPIGEENRTIIASLTFEGKKDRIYFDIAVNSTKTIIESLVKTKARSMAQRPPKTTVVLLPSGEQLALPSTLSELFLKTHFPDCATVRLHVIE